MAQPAPALDLASRQLEGTSCMAATCQNKGGTEVCLTNVTLATLSSHPLCVIVFSLVKVYLIFKLSPVRTRDFCSVSPSYIQVIPCAYSCFL